MLILQNIIHVQVHFVPSVQLTQFPAIDQTPENFAFFKSSRLISRSVSIRPHREMSNSSIAILNPRLVLGLRTNVRGNAYYVSDEDILYPVGCLLSLHNFNQRRQKFIRLPERGQNVVSVTVSPHK